MTHVTRAVECYLARLRAGASEEAFFGLWDLGPSALPNLIAEAQKPSARTIKAALVEIIWQSREPAVLGFLCECLEDPDSSVWKQALDGLVAIGGSPAVLYLQTVSERVIIGSFPKNGLSLEWLTEALDQIDGS
jgi:hypothetical protein